MKLPKTTQVHYVTVLEVRVYHRSHWAKIRVQAGLHSLLEVLRGSLLHFQESRVHLLSVAYAPFLRLHSRVRPSPRSASFVHFQGALRSHWAHQGNTGHSPYQSQLISNLNSPEPYRVTY